MARIACHWDKNGNGKADNKGELASTDHILLAPDLAERAESATIINNYEPEGISDHYPIVVTFRNAESEDR